VPEPNNIVPFIPYVIEKDDNVLRQKPPLLLPGWQKIDLATVEVVPSRGTENKFHFKIKNDTLISFVVDAVCTRNFWVKKLQEAKN